MKSVIREIEYFFRRVEKAWILKDIKQIIPSYCRGHNEPRKSWFASYK